VKNLVQVKYSKYVQYNRASKVGMKSDKPMEGLVPCFSCCASEIHRCRTKITVV